MADAGATIDVTPEIDPYAYDATPAAINAGRGVTGPWWLYVILAVGLYFLWED